MSISRLSDYPQILLTQKDPLLHLLSISGTTLDKSLHPGAKHAFQDVFSIITQKIANRLKKIVAIGEFVSGQEMLDVTEEIEVRVCYIK
jgi:hypothetical protein